MATPTRPLPAWLEAELWRAVRKNDFIVMYEPAWSFLSGNLDGCTVESRQSLPRIQRADCPGD